METTSIFSADNKFSFELTSSSDFTQAPNFDYLADQIKVNNQLNQNTEGIQDYISRNEQINLLQQPSGENSGKSGEFLDPQHKLLKEFNNEIKAQLLEQQFKLSEQIRAHLSQIKSVSKNRQEVGVQLFDLQKRVKKIQNNIKLVDKSSSEVKEELYRIDLVLKQEESVLLRRRESLSDLQKKIFQSVEQLSTMQSNLNDLTNEAKLQKLKFKTQSDEKSQVQSQYKEIETNINQSNFNIAKLEQSVRKKKSKLSLLNTSLETQQKELDVNQKAVQQTKEELESLKQLNKSCAKQLETSRFELKKKETKLFESNKLLESFSEQKENYDTDIKSINVSLTNEKERGKKLAYEHSSYEERLQGLKVESKVFESGVAELNNKIILKSSEVTKVNESIHATNHQVAETEQKLEATVKQFELSSERVKSARESLFNLINQEAISDKFYSQMSQGQKKSNWSLKDNEIVIEKIKNEIADVNLRLTDTEFKKESLKMNFQKVLDEFKKTEKAVIEQEQRIQRQYIIIEKKQLHVNRLSNFISIEKSKSGSDFSGEDEQKIQCLKEECLELTQVNKEKEKLLKEMEAKTTSYKNKIISLNELITSQNHSLLVLSHQSSTLNKKLNSLISMRCKAKKKLMNEQAELSRINSVLVEKTYFVKKLGEEMAHINTLIESKQLEGSQKIAYVEEMSIEMGRKTAQIQTQLNEMENQADKLNQDLNTSKSNIPEEYTKPKQESIKMQYVKLERFKQKQKGVLVEQNKASKALKQWAQSKQYKFNLDYLDSDNDHLKMNNALAETTRKINMINRKIKSYEGQLKSTVNEKEILENELQKAEDDYGEKHAQLEYLRNELDNKRLEVMIIKTDRDKTFSEGYNYQRLYSMLKSTHPNAIKKEIHNISDKLSGTKKKHEILVEAIITQKVKFPKFAKIFDMFEEWMLKIVPIIKEQKLHM